MFLQVAVFSQPRAIVAGVLPLFRGALGTLNQTYLYTIVINRCGGNDLNKQIRYVHGVNPVTGKPCTVRLVVTSEDVTLWQVDREIYSEAAFDQIDTENMGMVCLTRQSFREIVWAYSAGTDALDLETTQLEEAEQEALAMQDIADEEAEAKARAEYERDEDEKSRHMEDEGSPEEATL